MIDWRDGLVDALPVPDDRRPLHERQGEESNTEAQDITHRIASLSLGSSKHAFRFFDLPAELRNRIYHYVLFSKPGYRRARGGRRASRLACMLVNKRMHQESAYVLYATHRFQIFPLQLFEALPTVQELPPCYQVLVKNLAMVVGSSWTNPPKSWKVTRHLAKCLKKLPVETLRVFVDFDPSHPAFARYRVSENFYTDFCGDLLGDVLEIMPQLQYVELDGNPGVDVNGPLVSRLRNEALDQEKIIRYGKEGEWAYKVA